MRHVQLKTHEDVRKNIKRFGKVLSLIVNFERVSPYLEYSLKSYVSQR